MASKTYIANRVADYLGKSDMLDIETDTTEHGKAIRRIYDEVGARCLRKSSWPWAIKRITLNPDTATPVNEFSTKFVVPADCVKILRVWPNYIKYKSEDKFIICNEPTITVKYVSNEPLVKTYKMDSVFVEYFAAELAATLCYKFVDSIQKRQEIKQNAKELFMEAAALYSQEDTEDDIEESEWITARLVDLPFDNDLYVDGLET